MIYRTILLAIHLRVAIHFQFHSVENSLWTAYIRQEVQLMLTNPRDALTGQSRSPNMVPFDIYEKSYTFINFW